MVTISFLLLRILGGRGIGQEACWLLDFAVSAAEGVVAVVTGHLIAGAAGMLKVTGGRN